MSWIHQAGHGAVLLSAEVQLRHIIQTQWNDFKLKQETSQGSFIKAPFACLLLLDGDFECSFAFFAAPAWLRWFSKIQNIHSYKFVVEAIKKYQIIICFKWHQIQFNVQIQFSFKTEELS